MHNTSRLIIISMMLFVLLAGLLTGCKGTQTDLTTSNTSGIPAKTIEMSPSSMPVTSVLSTTTKNTTAPSPSVPGAATKIFNYASPAIIKYDSNGQQIWAHIASNPNISKNIALASKLDESGNLYVIGDSEILKYDSSGKLMWEVPFKASFVATASAFGSTENMYICGYDNAISDKNQAVFLAYDNNGKQIWTRRYEKSDARFIPLSIKLDGENNLYSIGKNAVTNFETLKFDNLGTLIWSTYYLGPSKGGNSKKIILDRNYNIYVNLGDIIIKYDNNGQQLWRASLDNIPQDLKIDLQDNLVVAGSGVSLNQQNSDYITTKYNGECQEIWKRYYDIPGTSGTITYAQPTLLAIDSYGNVVVTGHANHDNKSTYDTVKYDCNGNQLWVASYEEKGWNHSASLFIDKPGNEYIAGLTGIDDIFGEQLNCTFSTVKYDQDGKQIWTAKYGKIAGTYASVNVETDSSGNVFVTGTISSIGPIKTSSP
jgi:hypothetical protein